VFDLNNWGNICVQCKPRFYSKSSTVFLANPNNEIITECELIDRCDYNEEGG